MWGSVLGEMKKGIGGWVRMWESVGRGVGSVFGCG